MSKSYKMIVTIVDNDGNVLSNSTVNIDFKQKQRVKKTITKDPKDTDITEKAPYAEIIDIIREQKSISLQSIDCCFQDIPSSTIRSRVYRLKNAGILKQVERGVYTLCNEDITDNTDDPIPALELSF